MGNVEPRPDSKETGSPSKNRRSGVRHVCRVKILFNKNKGGQDDETWCVGKVVDVSVGLLQKAAIVSLVRKNLA